MNTLTRWLRHLVLFVRGRLCPACWTGELVDIQVRTAFQVQTMGMRCESCLRWMRSDLSDHRPPRPH